MSKDDKNYRVQQIKIKKGHRMYPYFDRICLGTKNLYNVGNFYIRQCSTGLSKDTNLTSNEKDAISLINSTIPKLNQLKVDYYNKRVAKEALKPKGNKEVEFKSLCGFITNNLNSGMSEGKAVNEITGRTYINFYDYIDLLTKFKYITRAKRKIYFERSELSAIAKNKIQIGERLK